MDPDSMVFQARTTDFSSTPHRSIPTLSLLTPVNPSLMGPWKLRCQKSFTSIYSVFPTFPSLTVLTHPHHLHLDPSYLARSDPLILQSLL